MTVDRTRGVFLTFEGLPPTISDSQVVVHLADMRGLGFDIELWAFSITAESHAESLARGEEIEGRHGLTVRVFRAVRPAWPLSERINARRVAAAVAASDRDIAFVHARTEYPTVVAGLALGGARTRLIWDCRGDSLAESRPASDSGMLRRLLTPWVRRRVRNRIRQAARRCDRAIFVSEALQRLRSIDLANRPSTVIPCVASERLFFHDPNLREEVRGRLGIEPGRRVAIYSGSMAPYQSFPETVRLFARLRARDPDLLLLVLTPYTEKARPLLAGLDASDHRLLTARFDEVNGYLNAADFAVLLRRDDAINRVASPVKFAEFCLAGLPVILNGAVEQSAAIARELGNGVFCGADALPKRLEPFSTDRRSAVAQAAVGRLSRAAVRESYAKLYGA